MLVSIVYAAGPGIIHPMVSTRLVDDDTPLGPSFTKLGDHLVQCSKKISDDDLES